MTNTDHTRPYAVDVAQQIIVGLLRNEDAIAELAKSNAIAAGLDPHELTSARKIVGRWTREDSLLASIEPKLYEYYLDDACRRGYLVGDRSPSLDELRKLESAFYDRGSGGPAQDLD